MLRLFGRLASILGGEEQAERPLALPIIVIVEIDGSRPANPWLAERVMSRSRRPRSDNCHMPRQKRIDGSADGWQEQQQGGDVGQEPWQHQQEGGNADQRRIEKGASGKAARRKFAAHPVDDAEALLAQQQSAPDRGSDDQAQRGQNADQLSYLDENGNFNQRQDDDRKEQQAGQSVVFLMVTAANRNLPQGELVLGQALPIYRTISPLREPVTLEEVRLFCQDS